MNDSISKPILVTGGHGKTGKRVAKRLAARGVAVRIGSRRGSPAFAWERPDTWGPALGGARAVYVAYAPDLAIPGADVTLAAFAREAMAHDVRRMVLLSGRGEPQAARAEQAVRESGIDLTVVRASWFCQNFDEGHLADAVREGTLAMPAGDVTEPFIDANDVADVAALALLDDAHVGLVHEVTGPRLLSFREVAAEISEAAGRAVSYVPLSAGEFRAALVPLMPPAEAAFFGELFPFLLDGHNASTTDTVERILGRKARDFRAYAREAASTWTA